MSQQDPDDNGAQGSNFSDNDIRTVAKSDDEDGGDVQQNNLILPRSPSQARGSESHDLDGGGDKGSSSSVNQELLEAARIGDKTGLESALTNGADVRTIGEFEETALHLASRMGHMDIVRTLLDNGADPNVRDYDGWVPLYTASISGWTKIVEFLLQYTSDINARTNRGLTSLIGAVEISNLDIVKLLLSHYADVNLTTNDGWTALSTAIYRNQVEFVTLLLDAGADVHIRPKSSWTPLMIACEYSTIDVVKALLKQGQDVDAQDDDKWTALHFAARYGDEEMVAALLEYKPKIDERTINDYTALHMSLLNDKEANQVPIARLLISNGADITAVTNQGHAVLHLAVGDGCLDVVKFMLQQYQDINVLDGTAWTPLHNAIYKGRWDIVQFLVNEGARCDLKTSDTEETALTMSVLCLQRIEDGELGAEGKYIKRKSAIDAIEAIATKVSITEKRVAIRQTKNQADLDEVIAVMGMNESESEDSKLIWFAARPEKHNEIFAMLKAPSGGQMMSKKPATPLQLAAYHGNHILVWWLLRATPPSEHGDKDRKTAQLIVEQRRNKLLKATKEGEALRTEPNLGATRAKENESSLARDRTDDFSGNMPRGPNRTRGAGARPAKVEPEEADKFSLTLDMLKDPPPVPDISEELYDEPSITPNVRQHIKGCYATIMDFYHRNGRVDILRRSRSVWDVVYESNGLEAGPERIMEEARQTLGKISPEDAKERQYRREELGVRWVHLPANNMEWMEDLTKRICQEKKLSREEYLPLRDLIRRSWHELPTVTSKAKFMKPVCLKESALRRATTKMTDSTTSVDSQPDEKEDKEKPANNQKIGDKLDESSEFQNVDAGQKTVKARKRDVNSYERVAVYMPYITFGKCYRDDTERKGVSVGSGPLPHSVDVDVRERYDQLIKAYNGKVIHGTRSLDQFYYHSLADIAQRNQNQVVTRALIGGENGKGVDQTRHWWPILAIDQLWLWVIDEETVITSSTHRRDECEDPVVERIFNHLRETKGRRRGRPPPSSVGELSTFIVNFCVNFIDSINWKDFSPDPLRGATNEASSKSPRELFADTINDKAVKEKRLFEAFTDKMIRKQKQSRKRKERKQGSNTGSSDDSEDEECERGKQEGISKSNIKGGEPAENQENKNYDSSDDFESKDWRSISKAAKLLDEVKDIQDELSMLKAVLVQQSQVWGELLGDPSDRDDASGPRYALLQINEMKDMADAIQKSVHEILNLEQNGINITEAVLSREQADESMRQGKTLMVFTIVTVVFAPMTFLTSLFALNIASFQHDSQGQLLYQPAWIFPMIFCISSAIILLLMTCAFFEEIKAKLKTTFLTHDHQNKPRPSQQRPSAKYPSPKISGKSGTNAHETYLGNHVGSHAGPLEAGRHFSWGPQIAWLRRLVDRHGTSKPPTGDDHA